MKRPSVCRQALRVIPAVPVLFAAIVLIVVNLAQVCPAAIITVPADQPTIQDAINAASDGDEIIVSPGTYYENIYFGGKNIVLRSTDPTNPSVVSATIIDGSQSRSVVTFTGTEGGSAALAGLTLFRGHAYDGGGICGNGTLATIGNNVITGNSADHGGGLAYCNGSINNNSISGNHAIISGGGLAKCDGTIENNNIWGNIAERDSGGGFYSCDGRIQNNDIYYNSADSGSGGGVYECNAIVQNNTIYGNSAIAGGGLHWCNNTIQNNTISANRSSLYGGGLSWCHGTIENNLISGNYAPYGGGLDNCDGSVQNNVIFGNAAYYLGGALYTCDGTMQNNTIWGNSASDTGGGFYHCGGTIRNCIIWQNTAPRGPQIYIYNCSTPSYSCIQDWTGGGTGNISAAPQLADPAGADFHLLLTSPCIDAGCIVTISQDFEGDPRPWGGRSEPRGDGSDFDIGADEYIGPIGISFDASSEGWTSGTAEVFAPPGWRREAGSVKLAAANNTNTFGFWQSAANAVPANEHYLYRARFVVTTDVTDQARVATIRLRANAASFQQADVLTIDSVGNGGASPTPSGVTYDLYFVPPANDTYCMLAFDLMNFDPTDAPDAEVALDSVLVERFALSTLGSASTTWTYHFETDQGSWSTGDGQTGFTDPEFFWEAGALYLRSTTNTNTFGYWHSSDYDIATTSGLLYRGTFDVRTDVTNRSRVPQMRLRFNTENLQASRTLAIESVGDGANSPGITNTLYDRLYFLPPANCLGEGLIVSFDMLNFSPDDAPTGALILDRATIESFSPSTAP